MHGKIQIHVQDMKTTNKIDIRTELENVDPLGRYQLIVALMESLQMSRTMFDIIDAMLGEQIQKHSISFSGEEARARRGKEFMYED